MSAEIAIRTAVTTELDAIVAIDDAAASLYAEAGLDLALSPDHPFVRAEIERWERALEKEQLFVAVDEDSGLVGFAALGRIDGAAYLDQLSVIPPRMRRGIGAALLQRAFETTAGEPLWLTTYDHLPWNRPFYERFGFEKVPDAVCGPEVRDTLAHQRGALPEPEKRIAMIRPQ